MDEDGVDDVNLASVIDGSFSDGLGVLDMGEEITGDEIGTLMEGLSVVD